MVDRMPAGPQKRVTKLHTLGHRTRHRHCISSLSIKGTIWLNKQAVLEGSNDARTGMPSGITRGRNMRSKIRWFTEFCNSHYLSHFAAFFIDARTKRSVVESFKWLRFHAQTAKIFQSSVRLWWARARELKVPRRPHGGPTKATG